MSGPTLQAIAAINSALHAHRDLNGEWPSKICAGRVMLWDLAREIVAIDFAHDTLIFGRVQVDPHAAVQKCFSEIVAGGLSIYGAALRLDASLSLTGIACHSSETGT